MDEVIRGFNTGIRRIRAEGAKLNEVKPQAATPKEQVKILPIKQEEGNGDEGLKEAAKIVVGRGKEEVEAALKRASDEL